MDRSAYKSCMAKNMGGGRLKGLSKEDRKIEFCTIAKQCSKGIPYEEAREICLLPKEPKPARAFEGKRSTGQSCEKSAQKTAECVVSRLIDNKVYRDQALNINSVGIAIANALLECECPPQK
ncbi:hypothetical protein ES703_99139 [subsurface metagenome]